MQRVLGTAILSCALLAASTTASYTQETSSPLTCDGDVCPVAGKDAHHERVPNRELLPNETGGHGGRFTEADGQHPDRNAIPQDLQRLVRQPHFGDAAFKVEPLPDALALAALLSASETYVGITGPQLDAWRSFSSALIEFAEISRQRPEPDDDRLSGKVKSTDVFDRLSRDLDGYARTAADAKSALASLRERLSPDQQRRVNKIAPALAAYLRSPRERAAHLPPHFDRDAEIFP